jgi:hypothetical protein
MAIWHFEVILVPTVGILRLHKELPPLLEDLIAVNAEDVEIERRVENYWEGLSVPVEVTTRIERVLPRMPSWSPKAAMYGSADGSIIKIWKDHFSCRIDARQPVDSLIVLITEIAVQMDCKIIPVETGQLLDPEFNDIAGALKNSTAYRFSQDPKGTLKSMLDENEEIDPSRDDNG